MKFHRLLLLPCILLLVGQTHGQFGFNLRNIFNPVQNLFRPLMRGVNQIFGGSRFRDDGTASPQATGRDELFPDDCGRDEDKGTGKLCFPDGLLCQQRVNRGGVQRFGGHAYWFSWQDNDPSVRNAKWDWFNARNYCRKRCMDLVSFESRQEYDWVKGFINGNVPYFWTSGRLCDFDGCDRPDFFPKNLNGWFWSANQARLSPTNSNSAFHDWSKTGGAQKPQPDNREQIQQGGESESCMAVLNNFYGDGIKWHDVACHHEKPIICEDVEGHLNFARQTFPNIRIP
jgi:hypothetical protein